MSRIKRGLAALFVSALMLVTMAAPAFAFHHVFIPGGACGDENSGGNAGGNNATAKAALLASGQHTLPLAPVGTAAVEHSELITDTPTATCPAPQK